MLRRHFRFQLAVSLVAATALLSAAGCDRPALLDPSENSSLARSGVDDASKVEQLRAVRQATAQYHSTTQALDAGYLPDDHCVAVPGLGGMGFHWANPGLIDDTFDPMQPEAVLYAEGPGGNLVLVAVEYIVLDVGQPRPSFGDRPFDIRGTPNPAPHWSLHVWLYQPNPNGIFTPFNPTITCS